MYGTWSQHDQRVSDPIYGSGMLFTDQHGRQWHAEVEKATLMPTGPIRLAQPRSAPIEPDAKYLVIQRGRRGERTTSYDIHIDYDRWLADVTRAYQDQQRFLHEFQLQHPTATPEMVQARAGRLRLHPRVIEQLRGGNEYLLGLRSFDPSNEQDVWLEKWVRRPGRTAIDYTVPDDFPVGEKPPAPVITTAADIAEERPEQIRALRAQGKTWKEVAAVMGLSENRCMQLVKAEAPVGV